MLKGNMCMFQYAETFDHCYLYRGVLDHHNDMCDDSATKYNIGLDNVFITHMW